MENKLIQKLLDFNRDAAFIAEESGGILFCNDAYKNVPGIKESGIKNIFDGIDSSDKEKLRSLLSCKSKEEDIHFRLSDNKLFSFRVSSSEFDDGKVLCSFRSYQEQLRHTYRYELFNNLNDAVITTDTNLNITAWNKAAEVIYGWSKEEVTGRKLSGLPLTEMTESERNHSLSELEKKGSSRMIFTQRHKNGNPVFVEANTFVVRDDRGEISGYVSVNRDITTRLETMEELKRSEERYRQLFDENPLPIVIYREEDYSVLNVNKAAVKKFGFTSKQFLNKKIIDLVLTEDKNHFRKVTRPENRTIKREGISRTVTSTGEIIDIEYTSTRIKYKGSDSRLVVINDITDKRKAEEELYQSSARLDTIISNLPMLLIELDEKGRFILHKGNAVPDNGIKPDEIIGKSAYEVIGDVMVTRHNGEFLPMKEVIGKVMKGEMVAGHTTIGETHFDIYLVPLKKEEGKVTGLLGVCLDITERINLEKSYHQTEERFRLIAENASDLISMVSDKKYLYMSPSYEKLFGYTLDELQELKPLSLVHPDDKPLLKDWQEKGMLQFRVRNKEGNWRWMEGESFLISGDPQIVVGIARDITKRKLAQQALKESEERYRILFERNPLPMFVYDEESYKFLAVNESAIDHYGYSRDELLGMTIKDIRPADDVPLLMDLIARQRHGMRKPGIWRHIKKNGCIINVDVTTHEITFNGRPSRIVLANDVTEKVKAEKALRQSEEKYRRIVENANEGIWLFDAEWQTTFSNNKLGDILGYKVEEMENKSVFNFMFDEDREQTKEYLHKVQNGSREAIKLRLQHKDGSERWIVSNAVPVLSDDMTYSGSLALVTDVTEQRKAEMELDRTNEMLKALINGSPLSIIFLNNEGKTELWNPASEKMFGWKSEETLGLKLPFVPGEKVKESEELVKIVLEGNSFTGMEVNRVRKDGKKIDVSISASPMFDSNKKTIGTAAFLMDITERKLAEKEREKLFTEINDARKRLKILSSRLITVQENEKRNISRELHDEIGQILTAIKIDLGRLKQNTSRDDSGMLIDDCTALVEKTISVVRNLSHELRPSMIDDLGLAVALKWYTDKFSERTGIEVKTQISDIDKFIPQGSAITLFRICQEALTNIAKHSQADYVRLKLMEKNKTITLTVEDNGTGFDVKDALRLAAKGESLGLLSMQERAELLNGKLGIISSEKSGTKIKVSYQV